MSNSIEFTTGFAPRLRFLRNGTRGMDIDFFDETNGKHLAGRHLGQDDVKELMTFLSPPVASNAPAPTTTERVPVSTWYGFKVGDVVVQTQEMGPVTIERQVPKPVEPSHGFGTAYVFGRVDPQERYQGFKSKSGLFYYLNDEGHQRTARPDQYEGFRLED